MSRLDELRDELRELMASQEFAYAMGAGCGMGDHPTYRAIRDRAAELKCQISDEKWLNDFGATDRPGSGF